MHGIFLFEESVSLTTGFVTFCCFNLTVMVITLSVKLLELDICSNPGPALAWLVAMAITPTIWIFRNDNMKEKAKLYKKLSIQSTKAV